MLKVEGLKVRYGHREAVHNVSLTVEEGTAPALRRDFASDDQLATGRRVEDGLDYRRFFA